MSKSIYSALLEALSPAAIDNALKALNEAGYVIVPREITDEMKEAVVERITAGDPKVQEAHRNNTRTNLRLYWPILLAASPPVQP